MKGNRKKKASTIPTDESIIPLLNLTTYINDWEKKGKFDADKQFVAAYGLVILTKIPTLQEYTTSPAYIKLMMQIPLKMLTEGLMCLEYETEFLSLENLDHCDKQKCAFITKLYSRYFLSERMGDDDTKHWPSLYIATYLTRRFPTKDVYLDIGDPFTPAPRPELANEKAAREELAHYRRQYPNVPKGMLYPNMERVFEFHYHKQPSQTYLVLLNSFAAKYGLDRNVLLEYDRDIRARKEAPDARLKLANGREYVVCSVSIEAKYRTLVWLHVGTTCALPECRVYRSVESKNLQKCSICLSTFYCGAEHQKKDWKRHKSLCKAT